MEIQQAPKYNPASEDRTGPEANQFANSIVSMLSSIDCDNYFKVKVKKDERGSIIKKLLDDIHLKLNSISDLNDWDKEKQVNEKHKDRFDFCYEVKLDGLDYIVIVELDACRADQVSKKFVSRACHTIDFPTLYFAFCYPGTKNMNYTECVKYMGYCQAIMDKLSTAIKPKTFVGMLINKPVKQKKQKKAKSR